MYRMVSMSVIPRNIVCESFGLGLPLFYYLKICKQSLGFFLVLKARAQIVQVG